nr:hypothetical protein [Tanacetum cinerariifolium]
MRSIISMVSISLEGFLPSILLLVVIIVTVVIVAVILVVVVIDAIVGVVIVVASIGVVVVVMIIGMVIVDGGVSHIIKLSFVIIGFFNVSFNALGKCPDESFHNFLGVCIPIGIVGICHGSSLCFQGYSNTLCNQLPDGSLGHSWCCRCRCSLGSHLSTYTANTEYRLRGTGMGDSTRVSMFLDEISLEGNKSWDSNIGDSDNTGYGGAIAGRPITTWGGRMVSYACMTSIFESSCKDEKTSMSKIYLVKSFEESGEMFPGKIIVMILVRDRCPRGKDLLRSSLRKGLLLLRVIEEEVRDEGGRIARWRLVSGVCVVWLEIEQQGDDVASWWPWNVFEVLVSCYGDVMEVLGITSSPSLSPEVSLSPQHSPISTSSSSQPPNTQPTPDAEGAAPLPHESPLHCVHSLRREDGSLSLNELTDLCTSLSKKVEVLESNLKKTKQIYSFAFTNLILRVKKLEKQVKPTIVRRRARIVISEEEDAVEDSSKQGRKIYELDQDPNISLIRTSDDTEVLQEEEEEEPTKIVEDQGSGEKGEREVSTIAAELSTGKDGVNTVSGLISTKISTASHVYSRRSTGIKAKDKGKGIMQESVPSKKIKKRVQIQMTVDEELAKNVFEEEQARFNVEQEARAKAEQEQEKFDFEIAQELEKQLDERRKADSIDWNTVAEQLQERQSVTIKTCQTLKKKPVLVAQSRKNMMIYLKNMAGYKMDYFKGICYEDIRPIFEVEYNKVQTLFKNRDVEEEKGQKVLEESAEKTEIEQVKIESSKKARGTRKKSLARKRARETLSKENAKKQKLEDDAEKEELQVYLNIILEDKSLDVEFLATKISVRPCCFINPRLTSPPYQTLSPSIDYQTAPPSTLNVSLPLSPITTLRMSPSKLLLTPKSTPPPLTFPLLPLPPQLSSLPSLPLTLSNPPLSFPPLSPLGPSNPFSMLTHEMFCDHCQRTQVIVDNLHDEMHFILIHILDHLNVLAHNY